jgi:hypothetical protein
MHVKAMKWSAALAVLAIIGYAATEMAGVPYGEDQLTVVNFSELKQAEKRVALRSANQARCTCGCGMTLAQCVATDSTCPVRETNIERIKTMVRTANHG